VAPYESFGLVLIEAMMWGLPIVASEWRGNQNVLTAGVGGITFQVTPALSQKIAGALETALAQEDHWICWGKTNRAIFEERYHERAGDLWLARGVMSS